MGKTEIKNQLRKPNKLDPFTLMNKNEDKKANDAKQRLNQRIVKK